jgi:integrin alpha FG-GAP repeat containing protein 1
VRIVRAALTRPWCSAVVQLPQSAYSPLQPPFNYLGIGRTNNYIEDFYVGLTLLQGSWSNRWVALIPNSQLIAWPYKPSDPSTWSLELFISPSTSLVLVSGAMLVILAFLGLVILHYHRLEVKEDIKEQNRDHTFAF